MTGNLLDHRTVQGALVRFGVLDAIDGVWGPKSAAGARLTVKRRVPVYRVDWPDARVRIALEQLLMFDANLPVGTIDGLVGPQTKYALERWQDRARDIDPDPQVVAHQSTAWPRQRDMAAFYGPPGTGHVQMELPYPMRLAWDKAALVNRVTIHGKCADSAKRALRRAGEYYGMDRLRELGLDLFGGIYNNRAMRGGKALSTHAFACAIDINPEANQLRWGADRAAMAKAECKPFLDAFEAEGWVSLGRERNFDWMHIQAARL